MNSKRLHSDDQGTCRRGNHPAGLLQFTSPATTRGACDDEPATINVRGIIVCERGLPNELWTRLAPPIPPRCDFRGQDSQRGGRNPPISRWSNRRNLNL